MFLHTLYCLIIVFSSSLNTSGSFPPLLLHFSSASAKSKVPSKNIPQAGKPSPFRYTDVLQPFTERRQNQSLNCEIKFQNITWWDFLRVVASWAVLVAIAPVVWLKKTIGIYSCCTPSQPLVIINACITRYSIVCKRKLAWYIDNHGIKICQAQWN